MARPDNPYLDTSELRVCTEELEQGDPISSSPCTPPTPRRPLVASTPGSDSAAGPQSRTTAVRTGDGRVLERALDNVGCLRETFRGVDEGLRAFSRAVEARLELVGEYSVAADQYIDQLEGRLDEVEQRTQDLTARLEAAEMQTGRLMCLYVATYQLHATLDPGVVQRTIAEITVNLLGADRFALLLRDEGAGGCRLAYAEGLEDLIDHPFTDPLYRGGEPMVDAALSSGQTCIGPMDGSASIAAAPLLVEGEAVGVLVLLKLLDHKKQLTFDDRELLELLASHAASALVLAQMHASADRKLRTLEDLVTLVRRHGASGSLPEALIVPRQNEKPS